MKVTYFPTTDTLYLDLVDRPSHESEEIASGIVVDFDVDGNVVGIEVEGAATRFDLRELEAGVDNERIAAFRFIRPASLSRP